MKVLITGVAGFIGHALAKVLCAEGHEVVGIDNMNDYYDVLLKHNRIADIESNEDYNFSFDKVDLSDRVAMENLFKTEHFTHVVNLGGQAGVRYSIENPFSYIDANIYGFMNILECCRHYPVEHLVYASSSSIYGDSTEIPYSEDSKTDSPVSLYAATKKSNELMAHAYSKLYNIRATGLRFFTVYGPWGRPDMAPFLFLKAIMKGEPIHVFNHGDMQRDFTYVDDIVEGVRRVLESQKCNSNVYNIGNSKPVQLMDFINTIENVTGKKFQIIYDEMQKGDVHCTYADTTKLYNDFGYRPSVSIEDGIRNFYNWYCEYYNA